MDNLTERLDALRQKLQESDFLQRKGLSNEVGIWIFQYNAADEMAVRHFTRQIAADQELHCRIIERNLYEIFLAILDDKHISAAIPRGSEPSTAKVLVATDSGGNASRSAEKISVKPPVLTPCALSSSVTMRTASGSLAPSVWVRWLTGYTPVNMVAHDGLVQSSTAL